MARNEVDEAIAESCLRSLIEELKRGFHPDNDPAVYVNVIDGRPTFTPAEVEHYRACLDLAHNVYGSQIYDKALGLLEELE